MPKSQLKAEGEQLAAEGVTVVAAAGDATDGDSATLVNDPATQPLVTAVGGTSLSTGNQGPLFSTYLSEEVWNTPELQTGVGGTTGRGFSSYWPIPSWQAAVNTTANGRSAKKRNVPDVAALGSLSTPGAVYHANPAPSWQLVGGTTVSSAIWAGFISIMNSAQQTAGLGSIGFFNPVLYSLAVTLDGQEGLHDVVYGNSGDPNGPDPGGYTAGPGYDNCSGWGSMYGTWFAAELLLTPTKQGTVPGAFAGLSATNSTTTAN